MKSPETIIFVAFAVSKFLPAAGLSSANFGPSQTKRRCCRVIRDMAAVCRVERHHGRLCGPDCRRYGDGADLHGQHDLLHNDRRARAAQTQKASSSNVAPRTRHGSCLSKGAGYVIDQKKSRPKAAFRSNPAITD